MGCLTEDHFPTNEYNKLNDHKIGPVKFIEKINQNVCRLQFPNDIHTSNVFNV